MSLFQILTNVRAALVNMVAPVLIWWVDSGASVRHNGPETFAQLVSQWFIYNHSFKTIKLFSQFEKELKYDWE
jgi:hypothetical protein